MPILTVLLPVHVNTGRFRLAVAVSGPICAPETSRIVAIKDGAYLGDNRRV